MDYTTFSTLFHCHFFMFFAFIKLKIGDGLRGIRRMMDNDQIKEAGRPSKNNSSLLRFIYFNTFKLN